MAIQTIDTATLVGLKAGADIYNANFTDTANAASKLVQTSPTDTTADALMAVGAFGLGSSVLPLIADINSFDNPTQFGRTDGSTTGTFTGLPSQFGAIEFVALAVNDFVKQVWTQASVTTVNTIPASFERVGHQSSGIFTAWQPVYTGANLNPNVFGGGGFVAMGWAFSTTVARFLLPTHGLSDPTSITLGGGTFDVLAGSAAVAGGVNTTAITLGSSGSNTPMGTVVQVSGLSGMVSGDFLQLFSDSSNSQITVNF